MNRSRFGIILAVFILIAVSFPSGGSATEYYTYNPQGRLLSVTFEDSTQIAYTYDRNGNILSVAVGKGVAAGVSESTRDGIPTAFSLSQNFPNPFNPSTTINFDLPQQTHVVLKVINMLGQEVATLVDGPEQAGYRSVVFDAGGLASGMYVYRLTAGSFTETRKLVLLH